MTLEEKAINIKGKKYILVSDRVLEFNQIYPEGSIETEIVQILETEMQIAKTTLIKKDKTYIVKATIYPDKERIRKFMGHSQATIGEGYINKTAALENAETSAIGRALAMMGIGVIDSIASVDELKKAGAIKETELPF